jgi:FKBP-type peptidyl-prolyl cis-trans isomerase FkpA
MRAIIILLTGMALLMAINTGCTKSARQDDTGKKITLDTLPQKASYVLGYSQGRGLKMKQLDTELDLDIYMQGMKDGIKGEGLIAEKNMNEVFKAFFDDFRKRQDEKNKVIGEKNKIEGEAFLKENAQKEGVKVTESGLQYMVLKEGTGPSPGPTDTVEVHYVGTLIDGTEFDSSIKRGESIKFPLNGVIPAWTEGLQLMKVGSKYRIFSPSNLAYGERGQGGQIGPNAVLIFEVELLGIEHPKEAPKPVPTPQPAKK